MHFAYFRLLVRGRAAPREELFALVEQVMRTGSALGISPRRLADLPSVAPLAWLASRGDSQGLRSLAGMGWKFLEGHGRRNAISTAIMGGYQDAALTLCDLIDEGALTCDEEHLSDALVLAVVHSELAVARRLLALGASRDAISRLQPGVLARVHGDVLRALREEGVRLPPEIVTLLDARGAIGD